MRQSASLAFGVVAGGDEQRCSGVDSDADTCDQGWCGGRDEWAEDVVDAFDLGVERLDSSGEFAQRELRGALHRGRIART